MIKVSVIVATYNQEKYIEKALRSIAAQKTDFEFEVLVGDDASKDGTGKIVEEFGKKYPSIIIPIVRKKNLGAFKNNYDLIKRAKGEYLAFLEGDDYWIDDQKLQKLQKQVDFMEAHPDFSECFTNSYVLNTETGKKKIAKTQIWDEADTEGLLKHRDNDNVQMSPGHTSTFLYRNQYLQDYPEWMYGDVMTDFPLYMLMSRYGKAKFINEITSVYRHRPDGVSSLNFTFEKNARKRIGVYRNVNRDFNYKYKKIINPIIADYYFGLGKRLYKTGQKGKGLKSLFQAFFFDPQVVIRRGVQ